MNPFGLTDLEPDPLTVQGAALDLPASAGRRAVFDEGIVTGPAGLLARGAARGYRALQRAQDPDSDPILSPEDANARWAIDGVLSFDRPVPESRAYELYRIKRGEAERQAIIANSDMSLWGALGAGLNAGVLDPVGAATALLPGGALARATPGIRALQASTSLGARAAAGFFEGAAMGVALEAVAYPLAAISEQRDYTVADSLLNVVVSGGFGAMGGVVGRYMEGAAPLDPARAAQAPQTVRQGAMEAAIVDAAADAPMAQPGAVLDSWQQVRAQAAEASGDAIAVRPIREDVAITPSGRRVGVEYALVEADDIITSHTANFQRDRRFPESLQPRDRSRADMQMQVEEIARNLDADRLGETFSAAEGAPIIAPDGLAESGNGRSLSIKKAYDTGQAEDYRAALAARGYDIEGMDKPVLVRVRRETLSGEDRLRFVQDANARATAAMSPGEQAMSDAGSMDPALFDAYTGGDAGLERNASFARGFVDRVAARADRNALVNADGTLSPAGARRLNDALVAYAYDDLDLILSLTEGTDEGFRTIGNALRAAAPEMAALRAKIRAGEVPAELDPAPSIAEAVTGARLARRMGDIELAIQQAGLSADDMVTQFMSPTGEAVLRAFYRSGNIKTPRSAAKIADYLATIARTIRDGATPDLMGEVNVRSTDDAARDAAEAFGRIAEREGKGSVAGDFRSIAESLRLRRGSGSAASGQPGPGRPGANREVDSTPEILTPGPAAPEAEARINTIRQDIAALDDLLPDAERSALSETDANTDDAVVSEALRAAAFCLKNGG